MTTTNPVLRGIEDAAKGISAERKRLNETFDALRATVHTFAPGSTLNDNGEVVEKSAIVQAFEQGQRDVARTLLAEEAAASTRLDKEGDGQTIALEPTPAAKPATIPNGKRSAQKAVLKQHFYEHPTTRITVGAAASIIGDETEVALHLLRALCGANIIERDPDAYYHLSEVEQRKMDPQTAAQRSEQKPAASPSSKAPGSPAPAAQAEQAAPSGGDEGPTTQRESDPTKPASSSAGAATSTTSGPTTPSASKPPSTSSWTPGSSTGAGGATGEQLVRSPKPWSEMRPMQRASEERLVTLVLWAQDQPETFDALTARRDLGEAVFSNPAQAADDFRTLEQRGVFQRTGNMIHPSWKKITGKGGGRGRTTPEYRLPKA